MKEYRGEDVVLQDVVLVSSVLLYTRVWELEPIFNLDAWAVLLRFGFLLC
jgi:hypothetical protein